MRRRLCGRFAGGRRVAEVVSEKGVGAFRLGRWWRGIWPLVGVRMPIPAPALWSLSVRVCRPAFAAGYRVGGTCAQAVVMCWVEPGSTQQ